MRQLTAIIYLMVFISFTACQSSKLSSISGRVSAGPKAKTIQKIIQLAEANICNPYWLQDSSWVAFVKDIQRQEVQQLSWPAFTKHFNKASKQLPFTHFYLVPQKRPASKGAAKAPFELTPISPKIAQLKIRSFAANAAPMVQLIEEIKAGQFERLIIDLRNNTGGTLDAAVVLGQFLTREQIDAGVYLSRKWFAQHSSYPEVSSIAQFPYLQDFTFRGFGQMLNKELAFRMVIPPHQREIFEGEVVVLINEHTASTCEPLVHLLQQKKVATLIGEKTAGAMLSGRYFKVDDEVKLFLPIADYMTGDGQRIDKMGVSPDIQVPAVEALDYTMETFFKK